MGRTDKLPPIPSKESSLDGYVLNDESWEIFLFALFSADNKPQDQSKSGNVIRWGNLYEGLNSGYRARFSVLDKNELVAWAVDNQKAYDICKDTKSHVDSSEQIPDALMAKLIKLWLLLTRAEGCEAKFGKLSGSDESTEKGSKKEDRSKTPLLNKKPSSVKTPSGKSEAKGSDSNSQRKDKLRDRVGGKTERVQSVGDEPADGPDMYIALKDFDSAGVFSILQEEHSIQINSIITLLESNKSVESITNANFLALKKGCENAPDLSLWKNTLWTQLENAETTDIRELQDKIAAKIYSILDRRKLYEKYYGSETYLDIPVIENPKELRNELRYYNSLLNAIGNQKAVTEDLILAVALEQVSRFEALSEEKWQEGMLIPEEASDISRYFENAMKKLAVTLNTSKNKVVKGSAGKSTKIVHYGDRHNFAIQEANALSLFDLNLEKLLLNIQSKFPMTKIQNIVAYALRRGLQDGIAAYRDRTLIQTEFKRFSDLSDEIIQRYLLQLDFEDILSKKIGKELNIKLNDWCWKEHFDKISLLQVLQNATWMCPNISTFACPREGSMLLTMMGSGDPFDLKAVRYHAFNIKSKVGLNLFSKLTEANPNALISSPNSVGYLAGDSISSFEQELTSLYPDNGAKIEISKWKTRTTEKVTGIYASRDMNLSWAFEDKVGKMPYVTLCLRDGTVLSVKKSNNSTAVTLSTADGLVIDLLPGKKIYQRLSGFQSINKEVSEVEVGRVIHSDGSVVRYLDDNLLQILQPNSNVISKKKDGLWIAVNSEGLKTTINQAKKVKTENMNILNENHSEIRKRTIEREDLVSTMIEHNHATLNFPDGTTMKVSCKGNESKLVDEFGNYRISGPYSISIEKNGLATVHFESDKDNQSLVLPNNVTVKRGTKLDGKTSENYLFLEQGKYSYELDSLGSFKVNERITVGKNTTYRTLFDLNWITGQFDLVDSSGNAFSISSTGESTVTKAELKPHVYAQMMNLPVGKNFAALVQGTIELPSRIPGNIPRLFMIRNDGSGIELLRDESVVEYFKDRLKDKQAEVIEETLPEPQNSMSFITIQPLNSQTLIYRNLVRFSPMTPEIRNKLMASISKYDSWKNTQDENSAKYIKFPVTNEKLDISSLSDVEDKTKEPYLSDFKNELEAKILKKYMPGEIISRKAPTLDNQYSDFRRASSIWTKPRLSKIPDKFAADQIHKPRKTSVVVPNKIINNVRDIPCYFNSPEGRYFVVQPTSKTKTDTIEETTSEHLSQEVQELQTSENVVQKDIKEIINEPKITADLDGNDIDQDPSVELIPQNAEEKISYDPLKVDIYGNPRSKKIPLPNAIKMKKAGAIPNEKFLNIEAQTKRTVKTISTGKKGVQYTLGTFQVLPSKAKFGILKEGYIYKTIINLVNVGLDSTRFRIKSPKSNRISLNYRKGPVAPGIKFSLEIIIDGRDLDSDQAFKISEDIEIVSESEYLFVPVLAEIHPADSPEIEKLRPNISIITNATIQA